MFSFALIETLLLVLFGSLVGKPLAVACDCHLVPFFFYKFLRFHSFCAAAARYLKFSEVMDSHVIFSVITFEGWGSCDIGQWSKR